ncbi:hypothetical protein BKA82DRAFT_3960293, partial [Pisolithus tinctorius]
PESGLHYIIGFMQAQGVCVQYCHVIQLLSRVDCLDHHMKTRHKYHIKQPNALWHMDSHHKLIQWGIIIHGFINGFCHIVS